MNRTALVYVNNIFAGKLFETDEGYGFLYDEEYINNHTACVSLTLPIKKEAYYSNVLFPFFDGLIPEGWLLDVVSRNWKIDRNDRFGLLLIACKDCIGNVTIKEEQV